MRFDTRQFKDSLKFYFLGGIIKFAESVSKGILQQLILGTMAVVIQISMIVLFPVSLLSAVLLSIRLGQ